MKSEDAGRKNVNYVAVILEGVIGCALMFALAIWLVRITGKAGSLLPLMVGMYILHWIRKRHFGKGLW